ncbi:B3/4 domain-containing protein [Streptomyces sp. t39]|uniref:B3/B4 domain-containing protein n=1 Tax=Streptomyces sp. t39 TaxID=1828156 RepID=UPI0011CD47C5|nr:phenylalanine--tRNA ligase beta subunit-related protein [Streptomyces sp. t39]TXS46965.1 hypothetical protein EAO77_32135 [Streptomyces sp. t39]
MTTFRLSPAVADAFPDTLVAVVITTGLRGREAWPATTAALQDLEQQVAAGTWAPADESDPRIEAWHTAYRSFGTNPRRIRPSVDALGRRLAKKGSLPRINPAVDSYNAVSVRHGLPAGAFDLDRVTGDVEIRYADSSETFTPLGEPGTTENPRAGEIIYADTTDVLTRHWNHRDAHRTRVTEDSTHVAFVLETLHATRDGHLLRTAAGELQDLLTGHSTRSTVHYLGPAHPRVTTQGSAPGSHVPSPG